MRFLSVAERELRAAARHQATYRIRWVTAAGFLALIWWMFWAFNGFRNRGAVPNIFSSLSVITFIYCLIVGATRTADCLSCEKREGTLGLLFLTNLNSAEIVAGKLCSSTLAAAYGLFAMFPLLAIPLLMGGVTVDTFWRTVLALVNAVFFSVAAGLVASALSVRQFPAIALGMILVLFFSLGLAGIAEALREFRYPNYWVEAVAVFSPYYALDSAASGARLFGQNRYWISLAAVQAMSWSWLALVSWWLARNWRDRTSSVRVFSGFSFTRRWRRRGNAGQVVLRRRLLEINPFFWLAGRQRVSSPVFLLLTVALVLITVELTTPYFGQWMKGNLSPLVGHLFGWVWTGLAIQALVFYYAATAASQRLAEDKQTGALELILSTPMTEQSISLGLWLAYGRRMFAPVIVAVLAYLFVIWHGANLFVLDAPGNIQLSITPGQLVWTALTNGSVAGEKLDWHFGFIIRVLLLVLVLLISNWVALGWVARWLGLRLKHPGFAPMIALAMVLIPPWLLFSLVCFVFDEMRLTRMPERQLLPVMMWIGFGIGMAHSVLLSAWAAGRLRRDFRSTVTSRFQPRAPFRWWRPSRRTLVRFAAGTAAVILLGFSFYWYQDWKSRRAWVAFQQDLKRRGESIDLSALLPGPVADEQNFAGADVFRGLLTRPRGGSSTNHALFDAVKGQLSALNSGYPGNPKPAEPWARQEYYDLAASRLLIAPGIDSRSSRSSRNTAADNLAAMTPLTEILRTAAVAAHRPFFQFTTNRDAATVLNGDHPAPMTLERLQFFFQLRACALLPLGRHSEAAEDILTSLRLTRLARQSPDMKASLRVQVMLDRSLQPLWEGLAERRWNADQLATFQTELLRFELLSDHTNAVGRIVRAYIDVWRRMADSAHLEQAALRQIGRFGNNPAQQFQPRAWWFDNCLQLYNAAQKSLAAVDVSEARVRANNSWSDLNGLQLDGSAMQIFHQAYWWGSGPALVAFTQTSVNQAITACALERHWLAKSAYPENLEALVPGFLSGIPRDVVRGRPMIYERLEAGRFILRGVGPNEINDQNKKSSDDWLWAYPAATNTPSATPSGKVR